MNPNKISSLGVGLATVFLPSEEPDFPRAWSPDGRYVVFTRGNDSDKRGFWIAPTFGDKKPYRFIDVLGPAAGAAISPDGKWFAYEASDTGRVEVYIVSFPEAKQKIAVSTGGGADPNCGFRTMPISVPG